MKKKNILSILAIVIILILGPTLYFRKIRTTKAAWFDDRFGYRTAITITNSGSAVQNQKVKLDIATDALYTAGKIQINCNDSRFTDANGKQLLYFLDSANGACNTNSTDYYVLMPTINAGSTVIYHYYGNPSAVKGSENAQFSQSTFSQSSTATSTEEQSKAPVAYWKFDEGQGTTLFSTGSNNNGTMGAGNSAPSWQTEDMCVSGKCLKFDGSNDYIGANTSSYAQNTAGTIAFWYKVIAGNSEQLLFSISNNSNTTQTELTVNVDTRTSGGIGIDFKLRADDSNKWKFDTRNSFSSTDVINNSSKWIYVALVQDGSQPKAYINGKLQTSNFTDSTDTTKWLKAILTDATTKANVITIGGIRRNGSLVAPFNGFLDEVKIYPYARSAAEIKSDYNAGKNRAGSEKGVAAGLGAPEFSTSSNSTTSSLSDGLVGYWKMDEAATPSVDSSGNGNNGTWYGTTAATTGKYGNGAYFDGDSDYIEKTDNASLDPPNAITVSMWFRPDQTLVNYQAVLGKGGGAAFEKGYEFASSGNLFGFWVNGAGHMATTTNPANGELAHWVGTFDGTQIKLYKNGSLVSTTDYASTITDTNLPFRIGRVSENGGNANYTKGMYDEVRIYNRALQPSEVADLYNWAPGPVGYWNFNEGVGSSAYDTSSLGQTGNLGPGSSSPSWSTGKIGKALSFDGIGDYVSVNRTQTLDMLNTDITTEAWIKIAGGNGTWRLIMSKNDGVNSPSYEFGVANTGKLAWYQEYGGSALKYSNTTLNERTWYHVAFVFNNLTKTGTFYLNGIPDGNVTGLLSTNTTTNPFYIGVDGPFGVSDMSFFNGNIDEVRLYNYARTQKQIVEDMNAGHPAVGSPVGSALAHYKFDEGYGNTVHNSGNGGATLNGTLGAGNSAPTWSQNGKFGKALSFDGSDYVNLGDPSNGSLDFSGDKKFSLSLWFKSSAATSTRQFLISKYAGSGNPGYYLDWSGTGAETNNKFRLLVYDNVDGNALSLEAGDVSYINNRWHHIVAVFDGATSLNSAIYLDGKLANKGQINQTGDFSNSQPLYVGNYVVSSVPFSGLIDEIKIYNYALTQDEIKLDYNQGQALVMGSLSSGTGNTAPATSASQEYCIPGDTATCSPPVARWDFNEGVGSSAYDTSGNGNLGAWNGTGTHWGTGKQGKAGKFNGTDDYVNYGDVMDSVFASSYSVSLWLKPKTLGRYQTPIGKWWDGSTRVFEILQYDSNYLNYRFSNSTGSVSLAISSNETLVANNWYHIEITYNHSSPYTHKMYINGILQTDQEDSQAGTSNSAPFRIGNERFSSTEQSYFDGLIDQVRIYNYARTPAQIAWDYNEGKPVAWYKFDECQGTTLNSQNETPNSTLNGTLNIGALGTQSSVGTCSLGVGTTAAWGVGSTGRLNASLNFDGTDDYAVTANVALLTGAGQSAPSLSWGAWVKPSTSVASKTIINKNNEFKLETDANSKPNCSVYANGSWQTASVGSTALSLSLWSHVLCTYDGTNTKVYINGLLSSTQATTGNILSLSSTPLNIARDPTPSQYYNGQIDEVKVWNYPLTPLQVKTDFNQGSGIRFGS